MFHNNKKSIYFKYKKYKIKIFVDVKFSIKQCNFHNMQYMHATNSNIMMYSGKHNVLYSGARVLIQTKHVLIIKPLL